MKSFRKPLLVAGGALALLLAAALTLPLWLKVDRFRPQIAKTLAEKLGRPVTLGELGFRLLPLPTVSVGPTALAGEKAGDEPVVAFKRAEARVAFLPLLRRQIRVKQILLEGLAANIERGRDGKLNLERFLAGIPAAKAEPAAKGGSPAPPLDLELDLLKISPVTIRYRGKPGAEPLAFPAELILKNFGRDPVSLELSLGKTRFTYEGRLDAAELEGKFAADRFRLGDLTPLLAVAGVTLPAGLDLDGDMRLEGKLGLAFADPAQARFDAHAKLSGGRLRLPALKAPVTGLGFTAAVDPEKISVSGIALKLLSSDLGGEVAVTQWRRAPRIAFAFASEKLEIGELANQLQSGAGGGSPAASSAGGDGPAFSAAGTLKVKEGGFGAFRFSNLSAKASAGPALARVSGLTANFFSGGLEADFSLKNRTGAFDFTASGKGIDVGQFLKAAAGAPYATGTAVFSVRGGGAIADPLALSGNASIAAEKGKLAKFPLLETINKALSVGKFSSVNEEELAYDQLTADFALGGGQAKTNNLKLRSPLTDMDAAGTLGFNLALDLAGTARLAKGRSDEMIARAGNLKYAADQDGRINLPFTASGTVDNPKLSVDTAALMKGAAAKVVDEKKRQVEEKAKDKAKEKAKDLLGGLFGK